MNPHGAFIHLADIDQEAVPFSIRKITSEPIVQTSSSRSALNDAPLLDASRRRWSRLLPRSSPIVVKV